MHLLDRSDSTARRAVERPIEDVGDDHYERVRRARAEFALHESIWVQPAVHADFATLAALVMADEKRGAVAVRGGFR